MHAKDIILNKRIPYKKYNFDSAIIPEIIDEKNYENARKKIQKLQEKTEKKKKTKEKQNQKNKRYIIVKAKSEKFNRKILENEQIYAIFGLELTEKKDKLKQKSSGLNEILAKIAVKNNIKIAVSLKELTKLGTTDKANLIARIKQNIKLCRKAKCSLIIASFAKKASEMRDAYDIFSLCLTLGMNTKQAKLALSKE